MSRAAQVIGVIPGASPNEANAESLLRVFVTKDVTKKKKKG